MSQRQSNLLWLRDIIEHLRESQQQLEWSEDAAAAHVLTDTMLRDLESCRRLCEALQRNARLQQVA